MVLDFLLDLVFPRFCVGCRKWGKFICEGCLGKSEFFDQQVCPYCERQSLYGFTHPRCRRRHGLDGMFVMAHYRGVVREAIRRVKYRGTYALVGELVRLLVGRYHHKFGFDYLVPIPLSLNRERERGFNQAEKFAKQINGQLAINSKQDKGRVVNLLKRVRETRPQFGLKYEEREKNVRGAFALDGSFNNDELITKYCKGRSLCLVDDVATTGATIFEGAKALKRGGAKNVWAICVARGG